MRLSVGFAVLGASSDYASGQFYLFGESRSPELPFFRPCPQTLSPSAASLVDEICSALGLAYPDGDDSAAILNTITRESLAQMVGTARSRVSRFMNKFKEFGFGAYDGGGLTVNGGLLSVPLHV